MKLDAGETGLVRTILKASMDRVGGADVVFHSVPVGMEGGGIRQRPRFKWPPAGKAVVLRRRADSMFGAGLLRDGSLSCNQREFQRFQSSN
jgi:hypothetical protein